ncbi:MAG: efflux RND transporter periplasmic adaptor subunit [Phycisphaerales bacterium]
MLDRSELLDRTTTPRRAFRRAGATSLTVVVVVVLVGVAVGGYMLSQRGGDEAATVSADLHVVEPTTFDISVIASGELEAQKQTEIRSRLERQGLITYVVAEGTRVKEGDLLIELNADEIQNEIEEDTLRVESSRSELVVAENALEIQKNENDAALRQALLKLELAQIELKKWEEGDLVKRRQELDLAIEKADRNLELYDEQYRQTKDLFDRGFESKDKLKEDEIRYIEAQAEVKRARLSKEVFEEYEYVQTQKRLTSDVNEADAELDRVKQQNNSRLASKEADLTNKRRQLAIHEERLAEEQRQLTYTKMYAPTDGLVVYATSVGDERGRSMMGGDGPLQIGRNVRPNELLIILPDTSRMVASVKVHESNAGRVQAGQAATVKVDALQNRVLSGTVDSISVLAASGGWRDPNLREYTVKIALEGDNTNRELKPSMRADAEIRLGRVEDVLTVPVQSVFREGRISYVYAKRGERFLRTPVRIGRRSSTQAEVIAGLEGGERILLREPQAGEILDQPFSEEALAAVAVPEDEQAEQARVVAASQPQGARQQGGQRGGFDVQGWLRDNAGKNIDDLELPEAMKTRLRQQFPDGKIPDDAGQGGSSSGGPSSAAATPASSAAE